VNIAQSSTSDEAPKSSSSSSQTINFPTTSPPSPPGDYLEPNTHFYVAAEPQDILQFLIGVLQEKSVDWCLCPNQYKLKCEAYHHSIRIEFIARIFHTPCPLAMPNDPPRYAVEFQRRFGDGMFYFQLFQEIHDAFSPIEANACPKRRQMRLEAPGLLECPELNIPELKCSRQTTMTDLQALLQMSSCECVDVKVMAIAALADMSANPEFRLLMIENGCAELFINSLNCKYGDVNRCAMTGLSNLISCGKNTPLCDKMLQELSTIQAMEKHAGSKCQKTVRETARAMSYLCDTLKAKAKDDDCIQRIIRSLATSRDNSVRETAAHAQGSLDTK
jgi:hypothetical protein